MAGHKHPSYLKIYITLVVLFIVSVIGPEVAPANWIPAVPASASQQQPRACMLVRSARGRMSRMSQFQFTCEIKICAPQSLIKI